MTSALDERLRTLEGDADRKGWPEPLPLSALVVRAASMPLELVPQALRAHVADVCERMNVPVEMVAVPLIVSIAAVIGRRLAIRPKRQDDWEVVPVLWGAIVARPGALKSPAIQEALRPFRRLEARRREQWVVERAKRVHDASIVALQAKVIESKITKALRKDEKIVDLKERLREKHAEQKELEIPEPRYSTNDATQEKLGELLRDNPRGILLSRDELIGWFKLLDRSGREGERAFFLEAWNGRGQFTVDRIGRGTIHIPALCVSVLGATQPGPLRSYVAEAMNETAGADGLLQRFQLLVWPDELPPWRNVDREPNDVARRGVFEIVERIDTLDVKSSAGDDDTLPFTRFDEAAQRLFDAFRDELETRLRSPELVLEPAFESCLGKHRSLMPALALVFHMIACAELNEYSPGVSERAAALAADWCGLMELHARKVYAQGGRSTAARLLADRIEEGTIRHGATVRDVYRNEWRGLTTPDEVIHAAVAVERIGWLRLQKPDSPGPGRPPSPVILLHPSFRGRA